MHKKNGHQGVNPFQMPNFPRLLNKELNSLIATALLDPEFCDLLLSNPAMAVEMNGEQDSFNLSAEDKTLLLSIQAVSLSDLATRIMEYYSQKHNGKLPSSTNGHTGYRKIIKLPENTGNN